MYSARCKVVQDSNHGGSAEALSRKMLEILYHQNTNAYSICRVVLVRLPLTVYLTETFWMVHPGGCEWWSLPDNLV